MAANRNLDAIVPQLKAAQERTGVKLLWGTANLFSHPRYMHGAATSPNADVFAYAAAQVKKAIEVTHELGGVNYVFWGGREGYSNLYNTDMKRELDHLAKFMHMAVDFAKSIGFKGQFLFEPKPKEPTKHQYDFDAAACLNFIRQYGLKEHVKLNIETNHATLAGHTMMHELVYASIQGALGSIDANTGDMLLGWDTDQFPTDLYLTTQCMLVILGQGGLAPGGVNFDAKVAAKVSSQSICSTPTSAGWTLSLAGSRSPPSCGPMACWPTLSRTATAATTQASARKSSKAKQPSPASRNTRSKRATPPPTKAAGRRCSKTSSTTISERMKAEGGRMSQRRGLRPQLSSYSSIILSFHFVLW